MFDFFRGGRRTPAAVPPRAAPILRFEISYNHRTETFELPFNTSLRALGQHLAQVFGVSYPSIKLLLPRGGRGAVHLLSNEQRSLLDAGITDGARIRMMASTEEAVRAARQQSARAGSAGPGSPRSARSGTPGSPRSARGGAPRGPLQASRSGRSARGAPGAQTPPSSARHAPRHASQVETRPWRGAGSQASGASSSSSSPSGPEAADAMLRRLAADVGVRRVLDARNWDLETLCERPPRGAAEPGPPPGPSGPVPSTRPFPGELWVRLRNSQRSSAHSGARRGALRAYPKTRDSLLRELAKRAADAGRAPGSRQEIEATFMREAATALREAGLQGGTEATHGAHHATAAAATPTPATATATATTTTQAAQAAHPGRPAPLQHPGSASFGGGAPSPAPARAESPAGSVASRGTDAASPGPEWGQGWVDSSLSSPAGSRRHPTPAAATSEAAGEHGHASARLAGSGPPSPSPSATPAPSSHAAFGGGAGRPARPSASEPPASPSTMSEELPALDASALQGAPEAPPDTEYSKGDMVLYRTREGPLVLVKVVAVDRSVAPPSYGIEIKGNYRETEGSRLRPIPKA